MPIPFSRLTLATSLSLFSLCGSAQEPIKTVLEEKLRGEAVLEKIIVTAQKRIQNIQSVPVSITAFDSQSLSSLGVLLASDIASQTPNLQASQPYGDAQPIDRKSVV